MAGIFGNYFDSGQGSGLLGLLGFDTPNPAMQTGLYNPGGGAPDARPYQPPTQDSPNIGGDIARSAGAGLVRGLAGQIGFPQAFGELGARGIGWMENKLGIPSRPDLYETGYRLPTAAQATSAIENNITGPLHQPQTEWGEYAQRFGEAVPAAMFVPGGMSVKYGPRLYQMLARPR